MDARTSQSTKMRTPALAQFVQEAWDAGSKIDLTGVGYGRSTWDDSGDIFTTPESYYRFLAGAAYLTRATSAVEVGTYWGGSTVSLAKGMLKHSSDVALVTVDITTNSDNFL